ALARAALARAALARAALARAALARAALARAALARAASAGRVAAMLGTALRMGGRRSRVPWAPAPGRWVLRLMPAQAR
ncbi:hypothetical protein ACGFY5_18930, partial [Cryptosporangium sp. NPDC048952]